MTLIATIAAILNMALAVFEGPAWTRLAAVALNLAFVFVGLGSDEMLAWGPHLALIPLNVALLIGSLGNRSA